MSAATRRFKHLLRHKKESCFCTLRKACLQYTARSLAQYCHCTVARTYKAHSDCAGP